MFVHKKCTKNEPRWKDVYERPADVSSISKGRTTLKIPFSLFRENRERLVLELRKVKPHALVVIQAACPASCFADRAYVQDSKLFWSFGYQETAAIGAIDIFRDKSYLILPRLSSCNMWCDKRARREIEKKFLVDGVWYLDEIECFLDYVKNYGCSEILILEYQKQELPACVLKYKVDSKALYQTMHDLMALKTEKEIKIIRYIAKHLEGALIHIMHRFRPGMTENDLKAWFSFYMTYKSGFDQSTLRTYSCNDPMDGKSYRSRSFSSRRKKLFKEGELCIIEVEAYYFGYKLSLGVVLPVSEIFDRLQEKAYEAMLRMRFGICHKLKAGLPVDCLRITAEKSLLEFLIKSRLVCGTVEETFEHGIGRLLVPHSLVRSLDVVCEEPKLLELGKVYLVQPGCYFAKDSLDAAYDDEDIKMYLAPELRLYEDIVVRVSDPVIITTNGFRFLSSMPRDPCTINYMRLRDESKKSDFLIEKRKENLMASPSKFSI